MNLSLLAWALVINTQRFVQHLELFLALARSYPTEQ